MQPGLTRKAVKTDALFDLGKYRRALRRYASLHRRFPGEQHFIVRILQCHELLGRDVREFLDRIKFPLSGGPSGTGEPETAMLSAIAQWLRLRPADDDLNLRRDLLSFAERLSGGSSTELGGEFGREFGTESDFGKALVQTFDSENQSALLEAIRWFGDDRCLTRITPQNVLTDRLIRLLMQVFNQCSQSSVQLEQVVVGLPTTTAFTDWPWTVFLALTRCELNPLQFNRIPDVTALPCTQPNRYARLWNLLWEAGDQDRLLEKYADHVATHCDDAGSNAATMRNRAIARSGDLSLLQLAAAPAETKLAVQEVNRRIKAGSKADFELLVSASKLAGRLAAQDFPAGPLRGLANLVIDTAVNCPDPAELPEAARFLANDAPLVIVPAKTVRSRLNKWLKRSTPLIPLTELSRFATSIPRVLPEYDQWQWFVFEQFREHDIDLVELNLLPNPAIGPTVKALQYSQLFQYVKQRADDKRLVETIGQVTQRSDDPDVLLTCWRFIAGCGRTDLLPGSLPDHVPNASEAPEDWLKELVDWGACAEQHQRNEREAVLLEFLRTREELQPASSRVTGLLRSHVQNKLQWSPRADASWRIFDEPFVNQSLNVEPLGGDYVQRQFIRWLDGQVSSIEPDQIRALHESLPNALKSLPESQWKFFELVDQRGFDAVDLAVLPDLAALPQANAIRHRGVWTHLSRYGHHSLARKLSRIVADRFDDREALVNILLSELREESLPEIATVRRWFEQPAAKILSPHLRDTLARDTLQRFTREPILQADAQTFFQSLEFLPLANPTVLAYEFRKSVGVFDQVFKATESELSPEKLFDQVPGTIPFDATWPLHRLVILKRRGVEIGDQAIDRAIETAFASTDSHSLPEVISAARSLEELGAAERLREFTSRGLQLATDLRLLLLHCGVSVLETDFPAAVDAAESGLLLCEISGRNEPRFVGHLFDMCFPRQIADADVHQPMDAGALMQRLASRLAGDSFDLNMLDQMIHVQQNEVSQDDALPLQQLTAQVLQQARSEDETWLKRQRLLYDFFRQRCGTKQRIDMLCPIETGLLPVDWAALIAQTLAATGRAVEAGVYCRHALKLEPDNPDALLLSARVAMADFRATEAMQICDQVLAKDPLNARAQSLRLNVMRFSGATNSDLLASVDHWSTAFPEHQQRSFRIQRLLDVALADEAFLESWQWHLEDQSGAEVFAFLGRSLMAMGELGLARSFIESSSADLIEQGFSGDFDRIETTRKMLEQPVIEQTEALQACQLLYDKLSGTEPENIAPLEQLSGRLLVPDSLMLAAVEHSEKQESADRSRGPIVIVSASLGAGGAERQVVYTATGIARRLKQPDDLVVVCANLGDQHNRAFFLADLDSENIRVELADDFVGTSGSVADTDFAAQLLESWPEARGGQNIRKYYAAFVKLQPRVVYASQDDTNILAGFAALLAGVPRIVLSGRSMNPSYFTEQSAWLKTAYRILLDCQHVSLVNNSQAGAVDYCRWIGISDDSASVIHNGFDFAAINARLNSRSDADIRAELNIPDGALVFGSVLRMHKVKRPAFCLDVIIELFKHFPDAVGLMIGDGPLAEDVRQQAEQSGLSSRMRFPGSLRPVEPYMAAMDLLLLCSQIEGLPNVLVESQAVGTPVTSTDVGGAKETFTPGESGLLLPEEEPAVLAQKIADWIHQEGSLQSAAVAGKNFALENFNLTRMIDNTIDLLKIDDLIDHQQADPELTGQANRRQKKPNHRSAWVALWKGKQFRELAEQTAEVAAEHDEFYPRFMQLRALSMLGEFEQARQVITLPVVANATAKEKRLLLIVLLVNAERCMQNDLQQSVDHFVLLNEMRLFNVGRIRDRVRGTYRQLANAACGERSNLQHPVLDRDHFVELLNRMPDHPVYDAGWPIFRLAMHERIGISDEDRSIESELNRIADRELPADDIVTLCGLLERRRQQNLSRQWSDRGCRLCSNPRLLKIRVEKLLEENDPAAVDQADRLLRASLLAGSLGLIPLRLLIDAVESQLMKSNSSTLSEHKGQAVAAEVIQRLSNLQLRDATEPLRTACELIIALHEKAIDRAVAILRSDPGVALQQDHATHAFAIMQRCVSMETIADLLRQQLASNQSDVPPAWVAALAGLYLRDGSLSLAMDVIDQGLEIAPQNQQLLRMKVRGLTAINKTASAEQICDELLKRDPTDLETWRARIAVLRAKKVSEAELIDVIDQAAANWQDANRQRSVRANLFDVGVLPHRSFAESWEWYQLQPDAPEASRSLGRALKSMSEFGLAHFFLERSGARTDGETDSPDDLSAVSLNDLHELLGAVPLDESTVVERCRRLAGEIVEGNRYLRLNESDNAGKLVRSPECFFDLIRRLAENPKSDFDGPACIVSSSLGPGGAERQVVYTAIGLTKELGSDNTVVLCGNLGEQRNTSFFLPRLKEAGVRVETAGPSDSCERSETLETMLRLWPENQGRRYIDSYHRFFVTERPPVVYAWQDETSVLAGIAAVLAGVPRIVMGGRSLSPAHRPTKPTYLHAAYQFLHSFDHVQMTNNSAAGARDYGKWLDMPAKKISVIHNGFDIDEIQTRLQAASPASIREQLEVPLDAILFGTVSRMNEVKRPDLCLDILLELLDLVPDSYAVMVGDGSMWQDVSARGLSSRHALRLRFPGAVHPSEPWMAAMDLMLLTSRVEGLPNVLIEAQATGTAVASTDVGGASETFVDGESGILLKTDDPRQCAQRIADFVTQRDALQRAGQAGKERVVREFSIEQMIKRTREILGV